MNQPQRLVTLLALAATMISASAVAKAALDPGNQSPGLQKYPGFTSSKYLKLTSVGGCSCGGGETGGTGGCSAIGPDGGAPI
jgi:hypothetical protein